MMDSEPRWQAAYQPIADRYTRAIETNDWQEVSRLWSPAFQMWNNFLQRDIGYAEALDMQRSMHRRVTDIRITNISRVYFAHGYFHRATFNGRNPAGIAFSLPYCFLAEIDEAGRICREDEYFTTHLLGWLQDGVDVFADTGKG